MTVRLELDFTEAFLLAEIVERYVRDTLADEHDRLIYDSLRAKVDDAKDRAMR